MGIRERIFELVDAKFNEQKDFAAALNAPASRISGWRTGKSDSFDRYIFQIAKVLDTTPEYLLTGEEKDPAAVPGDGELDLLSKAFVDAGIDVKALSDADRARIVRLAKAALDL